MKLQLYYPVKPYNISQGFGQCLTKALCNFYKSLGMIGHNGNDISCPVSTPIYASHKGEITYAGVDSEEGYGVVIKSLEQFEDTNNISSYWKTIYWHLTMNIPVRVGQVVDLGDIIGYGDTTGHASGPHLHFGLKPIAQGENEWIWYNLQQNNGYLGAIDPKPYFTGYYSQDTKIIIALLQNLVDVYQKLISLFKK